MACSRANFTFTLLYIKYVCTVTDRYSERVEMDISIYVPHISVNFVITKCRKFLILSTFRKFQLYFFLPEVFQDNYNAVSPMTYTHR